MGAAAEEKETPLQANEFRIRVVASALDEGKGKVPWMR